jgi:hypothetical protein
VTRARILVVGCGFPQLGLIRFCRAEGLEVVGLDQNPEAVGVAISDRFVCASTADADAIARAVREEGADGLTTAGSDLAVWPTALAAEPPGVPSTCRARWSRRRSTSMTCALVSRPEARRRRRTQWYGAWEKPNRSRIDWDGRWSSSLLAAGASAVYAS